MTTSHRQLISLLTLCSVLALAFQPPGLAITWCTALAKSTNSKDSSKGAKSENKTSKDDSKDEAIKEEEPKLSVTEHTVVIGGNPVKYKATAGYMILKDFHDKKQKEKADKEDKDKKEKDKGPKALAKMFFIAYTREDAGDIKRRPVTFSFNGGPGSSSVWLHMGALGPRKVVLSEKGEALPPPFRLEDNNYSWLDGTDLVFIDPVSTGYSRSEPDEDPKKFHGYNEDIESVGEFIRLYTTKYKRWTSPKFVVGESYGTTRAAGLSNFLQRRYGMYLNGIILVSAVLNFETIDFTPGNNVPYALFLPSYAATAWYHKKLPAALQAKSLSDLLDTVESFVANEYLMSLFHGGAVSGQRKQEISAKVAEFTGLPFEYVKRLDGRVPADLFFTHLLEDKNFVLGRFDGRYSGVRYNPARDEVDYDPSYEAVHGSFTATLNDYVRRELKFESELPYEIIANVWPWSMKDFENKYLNVSEDLRKAMTTNPYLKVWIASGYYDLATPYFASKYTVDQMFLDSALRKNVSMTYYDAGHMMYVLKPALVQFKKDFDAFLSGAVLPDSSVVPSASP